MSAILAFTLSNNGIVALCAVVTVALSAYVVVNSFLKDREKKENKAKAREEDVREEDQGVVARIGETVDHLTLTLVGRLPDPTTGLPGIDGFMQRQEKHNAVVMEELTTTNGGGTLKGSLGMLRTEVSDMRTDVDGIKQQVAHLSPAPAVEPS